MENPALEAFVKQLKEPLAFAQVLICRFSAEFELRNIQDTHLAPEKLKAVSLEEIRTLAQHTAGGAFRPLKSAPNLVSGWILFLKNDDELEFALNQLYPGGVADWFAVRSGSPPVTNYREFSERQSGMYRITTMLSDDSATKTIRACCHKKFCLKQRLWSVEGLACDSPTEKSLIPCLEPCAILLEFARKVVRLEQEEKNQVTSSPTPTDASLASSEIREADFNAPENPRRLQLLLESSCTQT